MKIAKLDAIEVLDSRGNPTVSVRVELDNSVVAYAGVPSGASTGEYEAVELRDGKSGYYRGKGVQGAVSNVCTTIRDALVGMSVEDPCAADAALIELDGTPNKEKLGANSILGVSIAVARARAAALGLPLYKSLKQSEAYTLPVPLVNVLNGGAHANNQLSIQEFMLVPHGAGSFAEALRYSAETFHALGQLLSEDGYSTALGDEGGYAPRLDSNDEAFSYLMRAIEMAGYRPGEQISLALDVAASEVCRSAGGKATYHIVGVGEELSSSDMVGYLKSIVERFPVRSIEDGLDENDWEGWKTLTSELGEMVQLVGDDLFVTSTSRLQRGIEEGIGNSILIKPNQIGTMSETIQAIELAHRSDFTSVVSHRSGETVDTTIADIAVGLSTGQIKTGSTARGERIAKYNRLLWIEADLGERAQLAQPYSS